MVNGRGKKKKSSDTQIYVQIFSTLFVRKLYFNLFGPQTFLGRNHVSLQRKSLFFITANNS